MKLERHKPRRPSVCRIKPRVRRQGNPLRIEIVSGVAVGKTMIVRNILRENGHVDAIVGPEEKSKTYRNMDELSKDIEQATNRSTQGCPHRTIHRVTLSTNKDGTAGTYGWTCVNCGKRFRPSVQ
jgi:hypothetical protein